MTLTDGVEPQTLVLTNLLSRFQFQHIAGVLAEIPSYIIIILNLPQEADTLRIPALGIHQMLTLRNLPHFILHVMTDGKESLTQLPVVNLC